MTSLLIHSIFLIGIIVECLNNVYASDIFYSVPAGSAYTWSNSIPQSCSCAENGVTQSSCTLFRCKCICDITAGVCDYGCCCDPDCTTDQIDRFGALDACMYSGGGHDTTQYCYSSNDLYAVNPKTPMEGTRTAEQGLNGALCVEKKNYAMKEDFYTDDDMKSSNIFQQTAGQKEYSYTDISDITIPATVADSFYDQNDTISGFMNSTLLSGFVSNGPGYLQVPSINFDGTCNDNNYASFENKVTLTDQDSTCLRTLSTNPAEFEAQCTSQFSIQRYVTDLWIAKTANIQVVSGAWLTSQMVNVQLNSIYFQDILTNEQTDITTDWLSNGCTTYSYSNSNVTDYVVTPSDSTCSFSSTATKRSILSNASLLCLGMVKSVEYIVNHASTADAEIESIRANVVITDVPMNWQDTQVVQFHQSYGIKYSSVNSDGLSSSNGNLVTRMRSGNPGYLMGFPVLYGFANGTKLIKELTTGLTVPTSTSSNVCPEDYSSVTTTSTSFGYDSITGCSMSLNRQQLINFCCTGAPGTCLDNSVIQTIQNSPFVSSTNGRPYFLNFTDGYVGIYGDADPLDVTQWFPITFKVPTDTRQWNDKTATCSNVFSGLNIQFLVSYSGERADPQNKIVSAIAEIVTSDWTLRLPPSDNTTAQSFQLSVVVSYIFSNEEKIKGYEPPAPPSLFKVPYDVFYPFVVNAASPSQSLSTMIMSMISSLSFFCIYFLLHE